MKYQRRFQVQAPVEEVVDFHRYSANMAVITPPPVVVRIHRAPERLTEGDEMAFTLWLGPIPLRWLVRIEDVTPSSFVDRQLKGPARRWRHQHVFVSVDETTTDVIDDVEIELQRHLLWGPIGLVMALNLPFLFAFRAWKTRRLLEKPATPSRNRTLPVALVISLAAWVGSRLKKGR